MSTHKLLLAMLVLFSLTVIGCSGADGEKEKKPEAEAEAEADAGADAGAQPEVVSNVEICKESFTAIADQDACQKSEATPEQVTKCVKDNPDLATAQANLVAAEQEASGAVRQRDVDAAAAKKAKAEKDIVAARTAEAAEAAALACVKTAKADAEAAAAAAAAAKAAEEAAAAAAAAAAEEPAAE